MLGGGTQGVGGALVEEWGVLADHPSGSCGMPLPWFVAWYGMALQAMLWYRRKGMAWYGMTWAEG